MSELQLQNRKRLCEAMCHKCESTEMYRISSRSSPAAYTAIFTKKLTHRFAAGPHFVQVLKRWREASSHCVHSNLLLSPIPAAGPTSKTALREKCIGKGCLSPRAVGNRSTSESCIDVP